MLDMAINGYVPYIFEEKPELYASFEGFKWYRNTISFGGHTNFGAPGIFGGYEYTPLEMQSRTGVSLKNKHNEALLLLPKIFIDHGFEVTITDPSYANYSWVPDLSIFTDYPQINAKNIIGSEYTDEWLVSKKAEILPLSLDKILENYLIRFSLFKFAPVLFRNFIYDDGNWLSTEDKISNSGIFLDNYAALNILSGITTVNENEINCYNVLSNELPHRPSFLQAPDYTLANYVTDRGNGVFANEDYYHVNMAALILLGKWFDFLKENNVYDNTRIIIVSDHGNDSHSKFQGNIILPNGKSLQRFAAFLLVKDFDSNGILSVDDSFMTNADVPLIALNGIVENPVNPWTGKLLASDKENGITLTTSQLWDVAKHPNYLFDIKPGEWLRVHTNIFDPVNWSQVQK
jgi:hypothetical protein